MTDLGFTLFWVVFAVFICGVVSFARDSEAEASEAIRWCHPAPARMLAGEWWCMPRSGEPYRWERTR